VLCARRRLSSRVGVAQKFSRILCVTTKTQFSNQRNLRRDGRSVTALGSSALTSAATPARDLLY